MVSVLLSKLYRLNQSLRVRDNRPAGPRLKPMQATEVFERRYRIVEPLNRVQLQYLRPDALRRAARLFRRRLHFQLRP